MNAHIVQETVKAEQSEPQQEQLDNDERNGMFPKMVVTALVGYGPADNVAYKPSEKD